MRGSRPASYFPSTTALILGLFATAHADAAEPPERSWAVKELIREAEAALARLDVARARELWGEVYEIERSNVAMCTMGQLDARMGRWAEAMVELLQCIDQMPAPRTAQERRLYERRHADLAAARRRVGEMHILPPPGAVGMFVNGRRVKDGSRIYVEPGQHEVTAVGQEGQVARAGVAVEAGESTSVPLAFDKPAPAPQGRAPEAKRAPGPVAPQASPRPGPDLRIAATGAMVSVGFLVTGVVCLQSAQGYEMEAKASWARAGVGGPFEATPPHGYNQMVDTAATGKLMSFLGTGSLIVGAAAGVATLVYVWWPNDTRIRVTAHGAEVRVRW